MHQLVLAGTGFMAETHTRQLTRMDDVSIEAVVSPSGPDSFIEKYDLDAAAYTDIEAALDGINADALDICTPTHTHLSLVETAADYGAAIFCEKPLARSLDEVAAIREIIEDADVPCMAGHVVRYFPEYAAVKRRVDDGAIGQLGVARARRLSPFPDWGSDGWFADDGKSGGVFLDMAIHDFDYLRWVGGEVDRVFARQTGTGQNSHGSVTLRFNSGAVGYVEASWAQPDSRELTTELEFAGDAGVLSIDSDDSQPYRTFTNQEKTVESPVAENGYFRELRHFFDCLDADADPDVGVKEAAIAMRLSLAARRSAETGRPVAPSEVNG